MMQTMTAPQETQSAGECSPTRRRHAGRTVTWWQGRPPGALAAVVSAYTLFALGALFYAYLFRHTLCIGNPPSCNTLMGANVSPLLVAAGNLAVSVWALAPIGLGLLLHAVYRGADLGIQVWALRVLCSSMAGTFIASIAGLVVGALVWNDPLGSGMIFLFAGSWCSLLGSIVFELCKTSWTRVTIVSAPGLLLAVMGFLP